MRWMGLATGLSAAVLAFAASAEAAEQTPMERQTLVELAYVLGQSHALRQACMGGDDQFWRGRMLRLVQTETPDPAFDKRLRDSFNAGFAADQAQVPWLAADAQPK